MVKVLDGEWENVGYGNSWSQGTVHAAQQPTGRLFGCHGASLYGNQQWCGVPGCTNRRALCYANFNARKNVMAIPHNAFKSEGEGEMECVCGEICDLFMLQ